MNYFYYAHDFCTIIAFIAIISSLIVVGKAGNNPVSAVLWLIVAFVASACYLISAGITFLGLSYIIVYVGAIAVLFLFVVIILNISGQENYANGALSATRIWPVASIILFIGFFTFFPINNYVNFTIDFPFIIFEQINSNIWNFQNNYINIDIIINKNIYTSGFDKNIFSQINSHSQIQNLGIILYTHGAMWLILISLLLILAMIVPLALAFTS